MRHEPIHILFTIPNFDTAGSQYVLQYLVTHLPSRYKAFIGVDRRLDLVPDCVPESQRVLIQKTGKLIPDAKTFSKQLKQLDIALIHSWDYRSELIEVLGARMASVPYLYTKKNNGWNKRWLLKSLLTNAIAYDNPDMKTRFYKSMFFKGKCTFIPHGVNTEMFVPASQPKTNTPFYIGCVGQVNDNKNQMFLVKLLVDLPAYVKLKLYGKADASYLQELLDLAKTLGVSDRVHYEQYVPNASLPKAIQQLHVFILPSKQEGLPVAVLEALACGIPTLSADSGGGARYIFRHKKGGAVFQLNEEKVVADWIMTCATDQNYYKKLQTEARNVALTFKAKDEANAYYNLYQTIIA